MQWLVIVLLVSLVVLLIAATGLVRHIWLQRRAQAPAEQAPAAPSGGDVKSKP